MVFALKKKQSSFFFLNSNSRLEIKIRGEIKDLTKKKVRKKEKRKKTENKKAKKKKGMILKIVEIFLALL